MPHKIAGLHHITAVSGPPQENFNFYRNTLGLRFIKKTINFDDPFTYHLYYGNHHAMPGSAITFFPWQHVADGTPGTGEATLVYYSIPDGSIEYWKERLDELQIPTGEPYERFGFRHLPLNDNNGMKIELVADPGIHNLQVHGYGGVPDENAIRGFFGVTLSLSDIGPTRDLLNEMGWQSEGSEKEITRLSSQPENGLGRYIDLKTESGINGRFGRGSIHHIAFRVPNDEIQAEWREKIREMGFNITPVKNRDYFRSVYFREPGGVLFEIATDTPGFDIDEPFEELGQNLKLPAWIEKEREEIERRLPELKT